MKRKFMGWFLFLIIPFLIYYFYPETKLPENRVVDKLIVYKGKRQMEAYSGKELLKIYTVSLGKAPVGHKQYEGDNRTPEGTYHITERNPNSSYHKNLGVSYPNELDIENAKNLGKPPGGAIKIHGLPNRLGHIGKLHRWKDWTAGCIAVTDAEVDELYLAVTHNAVIEINP
ncbi:L,D-transpeptidase family protein [Flavobacterium litorale]|uniref:L,D-transpeptidase family protein n=1 Tax=Flavobacterium litorale TaxID=2856519 RepID=A0ABX8V3D1_9FLAO|nr:L,D-transpeptidase family protein [Flavobacterium litorale]QYJ67353.1 L,D-transpeptidase family protein [Flavobacterium litorale]